MAPDAWAARPTSGRLRQSMLTGETCVVQGQHYFVRGLVEILVRGGDEPVFAWNVWSSLCRENFERAAAISHSPDRVREPPYFGWLSVELAPTYPPTTNLKLNIHLREPGHLPFLEVEPIDHPLAVEQREGISVERVREINETLLHRR